MREQSAVRKHLRRCPDCQHEYERINQLRYKIDQIPRFTVPASLETDITDRIASAHTQTLSASRWIRLSAWMMPIATHAVAALAGGIIFYSLLLLTGNPTIPGEEILTAHVRSLMDQKITQITSEDTHTVAPWFAGKIDFAPRVRDLNAQGYKLLGGRVDYLKDRNVAALVYLRRKHKINLFITPRAVGTVDLADSTMQWRRNGYNIVGWHDKDFKYWAISDLSAQELKVFSNLINEN